MGTLSPDDIKRLSVAERIELIGDLWDSLEHEAAALPASHRVELERRLNSFDEDIRNGTTWSDLRAELDSRAD